MGLERGAGERAGEDGKASERTGADRSECHPCFASRAGVTVTAIRRIPQTHKDCHIVSPTSMHPQNDVEGKKKKWRRRVSRCSTVSFLLDRGLLIMQFISSRGLVKISTIW